MNKKLLFCFLGISAFLIGFSVKANHLAGGDIQYKYLGVDSYYVEVKVYRDCSGILMSDFISVSINPVGCNSNGNRSINLPRKSVRILDITCQGEKSKCAGGTFPFGVEEHTYGLSFHLQKLFGTPLPANCCKIEIGFQTCCRNWGITNGFSNKPFYIFALLNRCVPGGNSSPQMTTPPIAVVCNNQPFCFNNGTIDPIDNDSLSYALDTPYQNINSRLLWSADFSMSSPLYYLGYPSDTLTFPLGFHLNAVTGDLCFQSVMVQQPVIVIRVTEWRKINGYYTVIGTVRRDMQFFTLNCPPNIPPEIKVNGTYNTPQIFTFCVGEKGCVQIKATDQDTTPSKRDTTLLDITKLPFNASFDHKNSSDIKLVREDEGSLCWTPSYSDISSLPHNFYLLAEDDNCPLKSKGTKIISVFVRAKPVIDRTYIKKGCFNYSLMASLLNPDQTGSTVTYHWIISGSADGRFTLGGSVSYQGNYIPFHHFPSAGSYVIQLTASASGCSTITYDTLRPEPSDNLARFSVFAGNDTSLCSGSALLRLNVYPMSGAYKQISWSFNPICNNCILFDQINSQLFFIPPYESQEKPYEFILSVADSGYCTNSDTSIIRILPNPSGDFYADHTESCGPAEIRFKGKLTNAFIYSWNFGDPSSGSVNFAETENPKHFYYHSGLYDVTLKTQSAEGCDTVVTKSEFVKIYAEPIADFSPDKSVAYYSLPHFSFINHSRNFTAADSIKFFWDFGDPLTDFDTSSLFSPGYTYPPEEKTYEVKLLARTIHQCESEAMAYVKVYPDFTLFAPSAFNPSSSKAEVKIFSIISDSCEQFQLKIFTRWGQEIYTATNNHLGWDGTFNGVSCEEGIYVWTVEATSFEGKSYHYSGTVTLLR